eukprot:5517583-Pyramimonas_sp.AAC.1
MALAEWNGPGVTTLLPLSTAALARMALQIVPDFRVVLAWLEKCTAEGEAKDNCRLTIVPEHGKYPSHWKCK